MLITALVISGWYVVEAGYMAARYRLVLDGHQLVGLIVLVLGLGMVIWHRISGRPEFVATLTRAERIAARIVHWTLYALMLGLPVTGYLAATADGPVKLFGLTLPVLIRVDSVALEVHVYAGYVVAVVAIFHASAALKHHFVNRDQTLRRMLGGKRD